MGQVSLKAETNNINKTLRQMHKHWMKVQSLSGAGINFPQEQTENTCIPKPQFRTTLSYKK